MPEPWQNEERLDRLVTECHGDVRAAVRRYTMDTLAALARRVNVSRATVNHTLAGYAGRKNPAVRRAIEVELHLPPYALDLLIEPPF